MSDAKDKDIAATKSDAELDAKVAVWIGSKEGSEKLIVTREAARTAAEHVRAAAKIEPDRLRKPITL
jgi:predicted alpha/beta superfamily hydrolase